MLFFVLPQIKIIGNKSTIPTLRQVYTLGFISKLPVLFPTGTYHYSMGLLNKLFPTGRTVILTRMRPVLPKIIAYALSDTDKALAVGIRCSNWVALMRSLKPFTPQKDTVTRSAVYRCLAKSGINTVPVAEKEKCKQFKAYELGFLHLDVAYMPKFNGVGSYPYYLFVAIDKATRAM